MPVRFQRRIRVVPGVRLNVSRGGVSTSFGRPGARLTVGTRGIRTSLGAPGTGLYAYSVTKSAQKRRGRSSGPTDGSFSLACFVAIMAAWGLSWPLWLAVGVGFLTLIAVEIVLIEEA